MPPGGVFHSVAAAVSFNRLPSFTNLLDLLGTNDVVFADLRYSEMVPNEQFTKV